MNGITVHKRDIVNVDIRYDMNGKAEKVVGDIKSFDAVKPFSSTGNREPITL